ncbi:HTH-type transcriptional activator RhaS [Paraburkholderia humisilvae]|uniref:HTH-type transcriptional activator RhaS n=3 Tax=Paraburkholderia humisilvae TaxID=627669 RepID=A0A6J5FAD0_9BURK|nr:HTH-type transcriptional activator RhaS [Paraburkholderia humisilvae]
MEQNTAFNAWNGARVDRDAWVDALSTRGWHCRFDVSHFGHSTMDIERAGQADISNINMAWQAVSPSLDRPGAVWSEEYLIVKLVRSGVLSIEQRGQTTKLGPGDIAVLDPQRMFIESMCEPAHFSALRIPKSTLRERGLRHSFPTALRPDMTLADVGAVRDFLLYLTAQAGKASESVLARLGDQFIDLFDVLTTGFDESAASRSGAATLLRARQLIARHLGDPDLSAGRIAGELNMSTSSLARVLRANGLSLMRYIWSLRLDQAARRLLGDVSHGEIKRIAYQCGFTSHAHFSRAFKARYGMTPSDYAGDHEMARRARAPRALTGNISGVGAS